jgi:hypothetical protein
MQGSKALYYQYHNLWPSQIPPHIVDNSLANCQLVLREGHLNFGAGIELLYNLYPAVNSQFSLYMLHRECRSRKTYNIPKNCPVVIFRHLNMSIIAYQFQIPRDKEPG